MAGFKDYASAADLGLPGLSRLMSHIGLCSLLVVLDLRGDLWSATSVAILTQVGVLECLGDVLGRLGGVFGVLRASWGRLGGVLRASWGRLGSVVLGASWERLGASWSALGRLGDVLGASWERLGASCGTVLNTKGLKIKPTIFGPKMLV